jgi:hypothetical protein
VDLDRLDQARATAEALLADARARGSVVGFVNGIGTRALTSLRAGALADAEGRALLLDRDLARGRRDLGPQPGVQPECLELALGVRMRKFTGSP